MTGPFIRGVLNRGFHLIVLFPGTPFPDAVRFGSAILVEVAGKKLLFDCGRGVVIRALEDNTIER